MKTTFLALTLTLPTAAAATQTGTFIALWDAASRARAVDGKTAAQTLATPKLKALLDEFASVAGAYRQQILDARAAGKTPRACPPKSLDLTVDAVVADVRALPPAWQTRDFAESFGAALDKRYPCGG